MWQRFFLGLLLMFSFEDLIEVWGKAKHGDVHHLVRYWEDSWPVSLSTLLGPAVRLTALFLDSEVGYDEEEPEPL